MRFTRRSLLAVAVMAFAFACTTRATAADSPTSGKYWVYFGTYTDKDGSKGIYRSELDSKTGKLSAPELAAEVTSPSFVHIAANGKTLYAVGEAGGKEGGGVYSFTLDAATGKLVKQSESTSGGSGPCHINTDGKGQFAIVANYGGGSTASYKLKEDGSIVSRVSHKQFPAVEKEGKKWDARGHCGSFDATGTLAFVCDAGTDRVHMFKVNQETAAFEANEPAFITMPKNSAPRHIHIAPSNDVAFVNGEADMTVNVLKLDVKANKFEVVQSLSTLPEGEKVSKGHSTAEVRIHPSGKFVYVSNRGHNTIAAFAFDKETSKLTPAGHIRGDIKTPRNFNISPDGKWMLIASQDGGKVGVYAIDEKTGLAKETEQVVKISKCVCVKFLAQP